MKSAIQSILSVGLLCATASLAQGAALVVDSYTATPSTLIPAYEDTGGVELTDGDVGSVVWPGAAVTGPLVGWQNIDATATFSFSTPVNITDITVWAADSNGAAGVGLPESIRVISGGFDQTFPVTDPPTAGTTIAIPINGLNLTTNSVQIDIARNTGANPDVCCATYQWTMVSEVQFEGSVIPEPSAALLLGLSGLAFLRRRRRA